MTETTVPELTEEQRRQNLERAMAARIERAELKRDLKAGKLSFADALDDKRAQKLYVRKLLQSAPGIGPAKAEAIMAKLHIAENRRVSGLGSRQRERLLALSEAGWAL